MEKALMDLPEIPVPMEKALMHLPETPALTKGAYGNCPGLNISPN
jgi:hypothetical protein